MTSIQSRLLLVEDVPVAQVAGKFLLNKLGFQVDTADNGAQALELTKENQYSLIFMDLGLPDMDGISVTQAIRNAPNSKNHKTIIIALTAHDEDVGKKICLETGMSDLISKPLTEEKAKGIFEKYLSP
ncbi:MAG: response regulator [Gammaproteobacteria bacterium]